MSAGEIWDADEVLANLERFIRSRLPDAMDERMERACIYVEGQAKERCRDVAMDDGQLVQSITHEVEQDEHGVTGYIGSNVEYAPYVHQGTGLYAVNGDGRQDVPWHYQAADGQWHTTSGQKPRPFLRDAIDGSREQILQFFKGAVD